MMRSLEYVYPSSARRIWRSVHKHFLTLIAIAFGALRAFDGKADWSAPLKIRSAGFQAKVAKF
jgi:hypothetical protein